MEDFITDTSTNDLDDMDIPLEKLIEFPELFALDSAKVVTPERVPARYLKLDASVMKSSISLLV